MAVDAGRILSLREAGHTYREISKALGCAPSYAHKVVHQFKVNTSVNIPGNDHRPVNAANATTAVDVGHYTDQDVQRSLAAVAGAAGNLRKAQKWLERDGLIVPEPLLKAWKDHDYRESYQRMRVETQEATRARAATTAEDLASRYSSLEHETLNRLEHELPDLKVDRLPATARELAVAKGINTDKARLHRGEATQITEVRRDFVDILAEINQRVPGLIGPGFVDSTATEEPPEESPELPPAA